MKCPLCGMPCKEGKIEIRGGLHLFESTTQIGTTAIWRPKDKEVSRWQKDAIHLGIDGKGWYCEECMKVFAELSQQ